MKQTLFFILITTGFLFAFSTNSNESITDSYDMIDCVEECIYANVDPVICKERCEGQ